MLCKSSLGALEGQCKAPGRTLHLAFFEIWTGQRKHSRFEIP